MPPNRLPYRVAKKLAAPRRGGPEDANRTLAHVEQLSKNARATWFSLLGFLAFSVIALFSAQDRDFYDLGAQSGVQLPLVGMSVSPFLFLLLTPPLLTALFVYLHVHLMKLWPALTKLHRKAETTDDDSWLQEKVFPWLITDYLLRRPKDAWIERTPLSPIADLATFMLCWAAAPAVLGYFWWRSALLHNPWITVFLGGLVALSFYAAFTSLFAALSSIRFKDWGATKLGRFHRNAPAMGVTAVVAIVALLGSVERTIGLDDRDNVAPVDLRWAELTPKPADWKDLDEWRKDFDRQWLAERRLTPGQPLTEQQVEERDRAADSDRSRLIAALRPPDLPGRRLNNADLSNAFMVGADLRRARMERANLRYAWMEGADLRRAEMQGAVLSSARMQGAVLSSARMDRAVLFGARMERVDLQEASIVGAMLFNARMERAFLWRTRMEGANLRTAQMGGVFLIEADLKSTDTKFTNLSGSSLISVDLTGSNITQARLDSAFGDASTILPANLVRPDHWSEDDLGDDVFEAANKWRVWRAERDLGPSRFCKDSQ